MSDRHPDEIVRQVIGGAELEARAHNPILSPGEIEGLRALVALLGAHREEFLAEYRRQFPDWERAGVECLADFERAALAEKEAVL